MKTGIEEEQAKNQAPIMLEAQNMLRKWEAGDKKIHELWTTMNGWVYDGFAQTYKQLGVSFDSYYYESDTYLLGKDIVDEGLSKGVFFKNISPTLLPSLKKELQSPHPPPFTNGRNAPEKALKASQPKLKPAARHS